MPIFWRDIPQTPKKGETSIPTPLPTPLPISKPGSMGSMFSWGLVFGWYCWWFRNLATVTTFWMVIKALYFFLGDKPTNLTPASIPGSSRYLKFLPLLVGFFGWFSEQILHTKGRSRYMKPYQKKTKRLHIFFSQTQLVWWVSLPDFFFFRQYVLLGCPGTEVRIKG